mmetsp:Transcript_17157/g.19303  ORF Transcript_17157/g.19303 Transcript_17157/m.19303 type:complete len:82 (+) Transcript_17157:625-870(+)
MYSPFSYSPVTPSKGQGKPKVSTFLNGKSFRILLVIDIFFDISSRLFLNFTLLLSKFSIYSYHLTFCVPITPLLHSTRYVS